jgi:hypothetical protein
MQIYLISIIVLILKNKYTYLVLSYHSYYIGTQKSLQRVNNYLIFSDNRGEYILQLY